MRSQLSQVNVRFRITQCEHVKKRDFAGSLSGQMEAQIAFVHRRNRMVAHRWMPVDAVDCASARREEIAEQHVTAQMRRGNHDGNIGRSGKRLGRSPSARPMLPVRRANCRRWSRLCTGRSARA